MADNNVIDMENEVVVEDNTDLELKWYEKAYLWASDHKCVMAAVASSIGTLLLGAFVQTLIGGSDDEPASACSDNYITYDDVEVHEF